MKIHNKEIFILWVGTFVFFIVLEVDFGVQIICGYGYSAGNYGKKI